MAFNFDFSLLTTIEIGILVLGLILLFMGASKRGKSKKDGATMKWLGIAAIVIGALPFFGTSLLGGLGDAPAAVATSTPGQSTQLCAVEDTTITLSAVNTYTEAAAGTTHGYRVNGNPRLTVANAGTFTASPGDTVEILWGNETDATYYADVTTEVVPCSGTATFTSQLYQNGTLTIEAFNEEGNLITSTENETLGSGDVVTLEANLKGTFQRGFPHGGVMVVEFNGTGSGSEIDDVVVDFGGSPTTVPSVYSISYGVQSRTKAYTIPPILGNQILRGSIVIDVDDSTNPNAVNDPILTFYPNDYFVNEDTGGSFDGPAVQDEDDSATFNHITTLTLSVD